MNEVDAELKHFENFAVSMLPKKYGGSRFIDGKPSTARAKYEELCREMAATSQNPVPCMFSGVAYVTKCSPKKGVCTFKGKPRTHVAQLSAAQRFEAATKAGIATVLVEN